MSGFFWNVRGFNKITKHSVVRSWINNGSFQFGCLLETRVKEKKSSKIISSVFQEWDVITNYESHHLGRIWVVWRQGARLIPMFKSDQMITCSIKLEGRDDEFLCSFIYASNCPEERKALWRDIKDHHDSPLFRQQS